MWILLFTVSFGLMQTVHCGGTVEVRLISYDYQLNGNHSSLCCDVNGTGSCDGCDPYIEISLADQSSLGVAVSNTGVTMHYNNTNHVDFGSSPSTGGHIFNISFSQFQSSYYLVFRVFDQNTSVPVVPPANKIDEPTFHVGQGEPSSFNSHPTFVVQAATGTYAVVNFEYIIQCEVYYYGICDVYCRPVLGQYTCNSGGHRVCEPGWTGANCTVHKVGTSCSDTACEHGATCVTTSTSSPTCMCTSDYAGQFCEIALPPSSTTDASNITGTSTTLAQTSSLASTGSSTNGPTALTHTGSTTASTTASTSTHSPIGVSSGHVSTNAPPTTHSTTNPRTSSSTYAGANATGFSLPALAVVTLSLNQSTLSLDTTKPGTNRDLTGIIVGAVLGTFLLALIAIALLVILCKKKKRKVEDAADSGKALPSVL